MVVTLICTVAVMPATTGTLFKGTVHGNERLSASSPPKLPVAGPEIG